MAVRVISVERKIVGQYSMATRAYFQIGDIEISFIRLPDGSPFEVSRINYGKQVLGPEASFIQRKDWNSLQGKVRAIFAEKRRAKPVQANFFDGAAH